MAANNTMKWHITRVQISVLVHGVNFPESTPKRWSTISQLVLLTGQGAIDSEHDRGILWPRGTQQWFRYVNEVSTLHSTLPPSPSLHVCTFHYALMT